MTTSGAALLERMTLRKAWPQLLRDGLAPLALYLFLRPRSTEMVALGASACLPAVGVIYTAARKRQMDRFGLAVLAGLLFSIASVTLLRTSRLLLLRGPVLLGLAGLTCLVSCAIRQPLLLPVTEGLFGDEPWDRAAARGPLNRATLAWGLALLVEAAVRAVLVFRLGIASNLILAPVLRYACTAAMIAWTCFYLRPLGIFAFPQPEQPASERLSPASGVSGVATTAGRFRSEAEVLTGASAADAAPGDDGGRTPPSAASLKHEV